jgi:hypothetical protein
LKGKNRAEIDRAWSHEKREKRASTGRSPLGRIGVRLLFSTKVLWGVGSWLKDAGRGLQKSGDPGDRGIRCVGKPGYSGESCTKYCAVIIILLGELTKNGAKGDAIPFWII